MAKRLDTQTETLYQQLHVSILARYDLTPGQHLIFAFETEEGLFLVAQSRMKVQPKVPWTIGHPAEKLSPETVRSFVEYMNGRSSILLVLTLVDGKKVNLRTDPGILNSGKVYRFEVKDRASTWDAETDPGEQ